MASRVKLLHALANIEQWAIDLAWDIVVRFAQTGSGKGKMPLAFFSDFCKVRAPSVSTVTSRSVNTKDLCRSQKTRQNTSPF